MAQRVVRVGSRSGLHARPAAIFCRAAGEQPVAVRIGRQGQASVDARSILAVLALGVTCGEQVVVQAEDGDRAEQVLDELAALLERDLDVE